MSDTAITWIPTQGIGDWSLSGGQLLTGDDIETALYISLFSDRVANPDDVIPDGSGDPRGWWGDTNKDRPIGSRLWLLSRAKQTTQTLNLAKDYITEALQWLIDDGLVDHFDITVEWTAASMLGMWIVSYAADGGTTSTQFLWNQNGT